MFERKETREPRDLDERVHYDDYYQSTAYRVVSTLKDKGYKIADCCGIRKDDPVKDVIGILKPRESVETRFSWLRRELRALFLGTLWLDNSCRGAKLNENWVLEVNGREHVPELKQLAVELAEQNNVKIELILETERAVTEEFESDRDPYHCYYKKVSAYST